MLDTTMRALASAHSPSGHAIIEWLCNSALREALTHCCVLGPNMGLGHENRFSHDPKKGAWTTRTLRS